MGQGRPWPAASQAKKMGPNLFFCVFLSQVSLFSVWSFLLSWPCCQGKGAAQKATPICLSEEPPRCVTTPTSLSLTSTIVVRSTQTWRNNSQGKVLPCGRFTGQGAILSTPLIPPPWRSGHSRGLDPVQGRNALPPPEAPPMGSTRDTFLLR